MKLELGFNLFIIFIFYFYLENGFGSVALGIKNTKWAGDRDLGKINSLGNEIYTGPTLIPSYLDPQLCICGRHRYISQPV